MDKIQIRGGARLSGEVVVGGSKNAALPIFISSLLTDDKCLFSRVPALNDIETSISLLRTLGMDVTRDLSKAEVRIAPLEGHDHLNTVEAPYDLVRKMRASVLVLGPLLARRKSAKVSLPGGCAIGARPINYHLSGFEKLGAKIELEDGYVIAKCKELRGNRVPFDFPSVGATENLLMAASLAKGETVLENCAKEPEIVDLANCLRGMGAEIQGDGTETIYIQGKDQLRGVSHSIMGDRIEAGTYLAAGFITQGKVKVLGINPLCLEAVLSKFEDAGAKIERGENYVELSSTTRPTGVDIQTAPYPGFPTDMQAQFMAIMAVARGASMVTEAIFENRFMHVPELCRFGADISIRGKNALVRGVDRLKGAPVMATDLRASASLVLAALVAEGESTISRVYHLDRGYEMLENKLSKLGAQIQRIS